MTELRVRITILFSVFATLVVLGRMDTREGEIYVLTESNLIVRHDFAPEETRLEYAVDVLNTPPAAAQPPEASRGPASVAAVPPAPQPQAAAPMRAEPESQERPLFAAAVEPVLRVESTPPEIVRQRDVTIDLDALAPSSDTRKLALNLFDDATYTGVVESLEQSSGGGVVLRGRLAEVENGSFIVVHENGRTLANVHAGRNIYQIQPASGETHVIRQIDPARATPAKVAASATDFERSVLVAFTPGLVAELGGMESAEALAQLALAEANASRRRPLILAGTMELETDESGDTAGDLQSLIDPSDGKWDEAAALREELQADIVLVIALQAQCADLIVDGEFHITGASCLNRR